MIQYLEMLIIFQIVATATTDNDQEKPGRIQGCLVFISNSFRFSFYWSYIYWSVIKETATHIRNDQDLGKSKYLQKFFQKFQKKAIFNRKSFYLNSNPGVEDYQLL